jgi:hypothetical protein
MARIRKTEPAVTVSAAAAPARRKTATATQKQATAAKKPRASSETSATAAVVEAVEVQYLPAQEKIAELAYSYWVSRGCQGGSPEEDWLRAEQELLQRAPALA